MTLRDDVAVVVPARCGSERVKLKNIRLLAGKPLLGYTVEAARDAGLAPIVSTDCQEIAAVAADFGARSMLRPAELATSTASTEAVLLHVLDALEREGTRPTWIVTLPPTSPLRRAETIMRFVGEVQRAPDDQDCLMSVTENRGDFWRMAGDGRIIRLFPSAPRRQQDREPLFEENSAIYITRTSALRDTGSILGRTQRGLAIDPIEGWDINTELDLETAELLLRIRLRGSGQGA